MDREFDLSKLRLKSLGQRSHKAHKEALTRPVSAKASFCEWLDSLPDFLGAKQLRATAKAVVAARKAGKPVVFAYGGHVIKTGCAPFIVDMIERGIITAVATNGSGAIHDVELAEWGGTSEEVAETIRDGSFGMVHETFAWFNRAADRGKDIGYGRAVGELLALGEAPGRHESIMHAAYKKDIVAAIHVAMGTDTVHMHPDADGAAIGAASMRDFRSIAQVVAEMGSKDDEPGGVWLNFGSAVILPEVFLKAVSIARNLGFDLDRIHTANFDMLQHYRPTQNVVIRPVSRGYGHSVTGHHEILLPLLRQAVVEALAL